MKKTIRQHWQRTRRILINLLFLGYAHDSWREQFILLLEWLRDILAPATQEEKGRKRGRWVRRTVPSLICLLVGLMLFLPVHAQNTPATQVSRANGPAQPRAAQDDHTGCTDTSTDSLQKDPLTGLPLTQTSGNTTLCWVPVKTACVTAMTSPAISSSSSGDMFFGTNGLLFANPLIGQNYWNDMLLAALALLAIPIAISGYQIMLGVASSHYAGAIEILTKTLQIAVLTGLSYALIQLAIQLENGIVQAVSAQIGASSSNALVSSDQWCQISQNFFTNLYDLTAYGLDNASGLLTGADFVNKNYTTTVALISNLPQDVKALLSILLAAQLMVRLALLDLYIVISPLAIISATLPGEIGRSILWGWLRGFLALLFLPFLQVLVLGAGGSLIPASLTTGTDWFNIALQTLWPVTVITVTLNLPRLFNASVATLLSSISSSMGGAMTSVILIVRGF